MSNELLDRRAVVRELLKDRGALLVIAGLGSPAYDVFAAGDHDANFYLWGAMGGAALVGLGLARAQPERPVVVITGDGEQLMGMGGLATIAVHRPANLTVVVLDNGYFGETGMQRSHTGMGLKLHAIAAASGFAAASELRTMADVTRYRQQLRRIEGGPRYASAHIAADMPPRALPPRDGSFLKNRLRAHLGFAVR